MARARRKGISCKRVRISGHTKTICRSTKSGRIVRGAASKRLTCPKKWKGLAVKKDRRGNCFVTTAKGGRRFVKKVTRRKRR